MSAPRSPVPARRAMPSREDPVVRAASEVLGGPLGRRAGGSSVAGTGWRLTPVAVLVVLTTLAALAGLLAKQHCRVRGWVPPDDYVHGCYSDVPALFGNRGFATGLFPYLQGSGDQVVEYPVLTGLLMWVEAQLVPGTGFTGPRALVFFDVNLVASYVFALVAVVATGLTVRHRPWDAAMVALAPGIILTATINWDMEAVALTAVALLLWSRNRPRAAGVLLGLAVAAKLYPLLLLGPLLLLCLRAGRMPAWRSAAAAAAGAWLAVDLPFMVLSWGNWLHFYRFSQERGAGFSSIWYVLANARHGVPPGQLNAVVTLSLAACCAAIAWLALAAPRRPRLAQLGLLTVAAFLLTNKVYSPQYVVWLVPLAALARPRWRDFLIWQACEAVHFMAVWLYIAGFTETSRALPSRWYGISVWVHVAGTLWLVAVVVRDVWWPDLDPVRADGSDDPGGGPLDGADDVLVLDGARLVARAAAVPAP